MSEILDRKYAKLLLNKCLNFNGTNTLLIEYTTHEFDNFVKIIEEEARNIGIGDIRFCCLDSDEIHDYLANTDIEDIKLNPLFDKSSWDEVAKMRGCVLHLYTTIPGLMNDIDPEKINKMRQISVTTNSYYRANATYNFSWVIGGYPTKRWAEFLFGKNEDSYDKLYDYIMKMCMIDSKDFEISWDNFINEINIYKNKLQDMNITKFTYKNSLGTNFEIGFPKGYKWVNLDKTDNLGNSIIVNMPSYEIFTTPDYRTANGIVYNSRPLVFNDNIIDDFYIEFKDGVAVNYKARVGNDLLKGLIETYKNANRLGEVALVNNDSPISNTGIVFYNSLFDENASCHLALGRGNLGAIDNCQNMSPEELDSIGINISPIHVDFMIGTPDLEITADTDKGKVLIFKDGNFNI